LGNGGGRPRLATPGSLGVTQNGAGGGDATQPEQAFQQGTARAALSEGTGQGIEATIIHV